MSYKFDQQPRAYKTSEMPPFMQVSDFRRFMLYSAYMAVLARIVRSPKTTDNYGLLIRHSTIFLPRPSGSTTTSTGCRSFENVQKNSAL